MVRKYFIGFAVVALLVTLARAHGDVTSGPKSTVSNMRGHGFFVEVSDNIRGFYVNTDNGLRLYVVIEDSGFVINGIDEKGAKLSANMKKLEKGQVKLAHNGTCDFANIPDGYLVTPGIGAHKLVSTKAQWNDARKICNNDGGDLAVLNSRAEETILVDMIQKAGLEDALLGVHDLYTNSNCRDWVTTQGVSLKDTGYEVWSPLLRPNPDNWQGKQHCIRLLNSGGMDDVECFYDRPYICEISCNDCPSDNFQPQLFPQPTV